MELIAGIFGLLFGVIIFIRQKELKKSNDKIKQVAAQRRKLAQENIQKIISNHLEALSIKQHQLLVRDAYGVIRTENWESEINYFIDNVLWQDALVKAYLGGVDTGNLEDVINALRINSSRMLEEQARGKRVPQSELDSAKNALDIINRLNSERTQQVKQQIHALVTSYRAKSISEGNSLPSPDVSNLDPIQFEHHCVDLLNNSGWNARTTKGSGDQGIDIIASYGNVKAVFQCKKYSQPVGNAAVQEVIAGKAFEQAHMAAVVSNALFTPAAKQLASATGVYLLHYTELPNLASKLGLIAK